MSSYDPMTLLTFDDMERLIQWWRSGEGASITLPNQTISGGEMQVSVDHEGVWITPVP